jgi:hypothetical protein
MNIRDVLAKMGDSNVEKWEKTIIELFFEEYMNKL